MQKISEKSVMSFSRDVIDERPPVDLIAFLTRATVE